MNQQQAAEEEGWEYEQHEEEESEQEEGDMEDFGADAASDGPATGEDGNAPAGGQPGGAEDGGDDSVACKPGAVWKMNRGLKLIQVNGTTILSTLRLPQTVVFAWFPGAALPLHISLQLLIDGTPLGPRSGCSIGSSFNIAGLSNYKQELSDCRTQSIRLVSTGDDGAPPKLDLLLTRPEPVGGTAAVEGQGGAASTSAKAPRVKGRALEPADFEDGMYPVNQTFTKCRALDNSFSVPASLCSQTPLRVQVVMDGTPKGSPLETRVSVYTKETGLVRVRATSDKIPLPRYADILRYRQVPGSSPTGPALVEVHARTPAGQQQAGQATAASGSDVSAASAASGKRRSADQQPPAAPQRPLQKRQRQQQPPLSESVPSAPLTSAAAAAVQPPAAAPQFGEALQGGSVAVDGAAEPAAAEAALAALAAELRELSLAATKPPPVQGHAEADAAALQNAVFEALGEVERAAAALGLSVATVDAVCRHVDAATAEPTAARRFLRMEYSRLVRAAAAGEVEVVRGWMAHAAAAAVVQ